MIDNYINYLNEKKNDIISGHKLTSDEKENIGLCLAYLSIYYNDTIETYDNNFYDFMDFIIVVFGNFYNERNNNELL